MPKMTDTATWQPIFDSNRIHYKRIRWAIIYLITGMAFGLSIFALTKKRELKLKLCSFGGKDQTIDLSIMCQVPFDRFVHGWHVFFLALLTWAEHLKLGM